ncbi:Protein of unknown function [Rhizobiales bacterium GAS191]|nr:Protein of unknown function [Rhizobiales bacterium GAS113]SEC58539.1 Protein of unknown function [Rhizobiales bacterium GAS188]SEC70023.1 Protein of unknown function [Rhizobiales bacterium GAS191]
MALTVNNVNEELIKFRKKAIFTFLRDSRFDRYTGTGPNYIIQRVMDLEADGKQINIPLLDQLRGDGVARGQLTGREESLDNYGYPMWADWARHGVLFNKANKKEAAINIREYGTPVLTSWTKRWRRDDMIDALLAIPTAAIPANYGQDPTPTTPSARVNGIRWAAATSTQRNNWLTANSDRIVFGHLAGNLVAGNFSSSAANLSSAADKMSAAIGLLAKRTAMATTNIANWPAIKPYMIEGGGDEEWYVCFVGSRSYRDLSQDSAMQTVNTTARPRDSGDPLKDNPIFTGAHLQKDGIIYREIPEIDQRYIIGPTGSVAAPLGPLAGIGSAGVDVAPFFLCGQSALGYVIGQLPQAKRRDETDYQFLDGIGIEMQYGVGKIAKDKPGNAGSVGTLKDWGMLTGFVAAPPDA